LAVVREWRLVVWLSLAQMISWGTLFYGFAVVARPMERELGWPKTDLYLAPTLGLLAAGAAAPFLGAWIDRHGGFWPMTLGSAAGGALMIAWAFVDTPMALYAVWVAMGVALACTLYEPGFAVVAANVTDWKRGILVMTFLGGLASTAFIPLGHLLIETWGWRSALIALGAVNLIVCVGIHAYWLPGTRAKGVAAEAAEKTAIGSAFGEAARKPAFWGLGIVYFAYNFASNSITFHLIGILGEREIDPEAIVLVWAVIGPAQVLSRVALMGFARIDARYVGRYAMAALFAGIAILASGTDALWALLAFAAIYGTGNGLMTIVKGTIAPDLLGPRGYATVNGALALPSNIARAVAPVAAAALWAAGGYPAVLAILLAGLAAGFAVFWAVTLRK
jgi:MFS family permease